jgi:hypothetical protein
VAALVTLARRLARQGGLAGVHAPDARALRALVAIGVATGIPAPAPEVVERVLDRRAACELWRARALPCVGPARRAAQLELNGFFRDGVFVPAGLHERFFAPAPHAAAEWGAQPPELPSAAQQAAYELVERGARALDLALGPVGAVLQPTPEGPALVELSPFFRDELVVGHVSPLAHGKSPLQSWFAALSGAGGPFDDFPLATGAQAGWMALLPDRTGTFAGVGGSERARAVPGIRDVLVFEAGREVTSLADEQAVCGYLWGQAATRAELEYRLRSARAALEVQVAWRKVA